MRTVPNNSTPIINEIVESLAFTRLSSHEFNVVMAIIRRTYGWDKKMDWISLSQLGEATNMKTPHVCRALKKLLEKRVVIKDGIKIGINKNTKQWGCLLPEQGVPEQGTPHTGNQVLPEQVIEVLPIQGDTKDTITKDTIQKKGGDFEKALDSFYEMRKDMKAKMTERAKELLLMKLEKMSGGEEKTKIALLEQSILNSWKGLYELKDDSVDMIAMHKKLGSIRFVKQYGEEEFKKIANSVL